MESVDVLSVSNIYKARSGKFRTGVQYAEQYAKATGICFSSARLAWSPGRRVSGARM